MDRISKYCSYKSTDLLDDDNFIAWTVRGQNHEQWERLLKDNPKFAEEAKKAKEIILFVRSVHEQNDEQFVRKIWQKIYQFNQTWKKPVRRLRVYRVAGWAASILLIVSLGTIIYRLSDYSNHCYQFNPTAENTKEKAKIILTNGKEFLLKEANSTIEVYNGKEVIINNNESITIYEDGTPNKKENRHNEVLVPYGKRSKITLADSTIVWLNAGSRLAFPTVFDKHSREVFLEGQAYFEVTRNEKQPFIVHALEIQVEVLGTCFDVMAYTSDDKIQTVLVEGSVQLNNPGKFGLIKNKVILEPHQKAEFKKADKTVLISNETNVNVFTSWKNGWLEFKNEGILNVLRKIERYYNVEIIEPEAFQEKKPISGKMDLKDSLTEVLTALSDIVEIEFYIKDRKVYIENKQ